MLTRARQKREMKGGNDEMSTEVESYLPRLAAWSPAAHPPSVMGASITFRCIEKRKEIKNIDFIYPLVVFRMF